jgi:hypothetical protein
MLAGLLNPVPARFSGALVVRGNLQVDAYVQGNSIFTGAVRIAAGRPRTVGVGYRVGRFCRPGSTGPRLGVPCTTTLFCRLNCGLPPSARPDVDHPAPTPHRDPPAYRTRPRCHGQAQAVY